jgi:hypothetical protein
MDNISTLETTDWGTSSVLTLALGLVATITLWVILIWILAKDHG